MAAVRTQNKTISPQQALERLETLCAKAERCSWELQRKLILWKIETEDAAEIMDSLHRRRFVDDARFARAFARDKSRFQGWGRRKIENELRLRHIPAPAIAEAISEVDQQDYTDKAAAVLARKATGMERPLSYADRTKLMRFMLTRGYEATHAAEQLQKLK